MYQGGSDVKRPVDLNSPSANHNIVRFRGAEQAVYRLQFMLTVEERSIRRDEKIIGFVIPKITNPIIDGYMKFY